MYFPLLYIMLLEKAGLDFICILVGCRTYCFAHNVRIVIHYNAPQQDFRQAGHAFAHAPAMHCGAILLECNPEIRELTENDFFSEMK